VVLDTVEIGDGPTAYSCWWRVAEIQIRVEFILQRPECGGPGPSGRWSGLDPLEEFEELTFFSPFGKPLDLPMAQYLGTPSLLNLLFAVLLFFGMLP
jgi:hypothetical protein